MGGYGSGRWSWHNRKIQVEECHKLTIKFLKPYLIPGNWNSVRWLRGECETGSIQYRVQGDDSPVSLRLIYTIGAKSGNPENFNYPVKLTTTSLPWGGVRYWFICPAVGCYRRVGCLYLPPGGKYFGCRHCYDLAYESQSEWHRDKHFYANLASMIQDVSPGITGDELKFLFDERYSWNSDRRYSEEYWRAVERREKREGYLNTEELCQQSGLSLENLRKLEEVRLLVPDTQDGRYRPKLAGWGKKLAYLLSEGWEIEEIKRWSKERWKTGNPRKWPPERKIR